METEDAHSPTPNMEGWESEYLAIDRSQQEQFLSTEWIDGIHQMHQDWNSMN